MFLVFLALPDGVLDRLLLGLGQLLVSLEMAVVMLVLPAGGLLGGGNMALGALGGEGRRSADNDQAQGQHGNEQLGLHKHVSLLIEIATRSLNLQRLSVQPISLHQCAGPEAKISLKNACISSHDFLS